MTRREFLRAYLLKFLIAVLLLGLILYVLGHAMGNSSVDLLTTPVRTVTDRRITSATAYIFRNEELLTSDASGLVESVVPNGSKVGRDMEVAKIYPATLSGDSFLSAQKRLDELSRAIRVLEQSRDAVKEPISNAEGYRTDAVEEYRRILSRLSTGDCSVTKELTDSFLADLNRYMLLSGKISELDSILQTLKTEKNTLTGAQSVSVKNQTASGVYYTDDYVDGYETLFTKEALDALTPEGFHALAEKSPVEQTGASLGKIVYGYSWYLAMTLPEELLLSPDATEEEKASFGGFLEGHQYTVSFPENGGRAILLTLERIVGTDIAVFRSDDSYADFLYYRSQRVEITVREDEGYYIPESALVERDGVLGVYVFENSTAYFRRIDILSFGDGYCIARPLGEGSVGEINQNDVIITFGKKLYDGKVYE